MGWVPGVGDERDLGSQTLGTSREHEVLQRAAPRDVQLAAERVERALTSRGIGEHVDPITRQHEPPGLRVVPVGGEHRGPDQPQQPVARRTPPHSLQAAYASPWPGVSTPWPTARAVIPDTPATATVAAPRPTQPNAARRDTSIRGPLSTRDASAGPAPGDAGSEFPAPRGMGVPVSPSCAISLLPSPASASVSCAPLAGGELVSSSDFKIPPTTRSSQGPTGLHRETYGRTLLPLAVALDEDRLKRRSRWIAETLCCPDGMGQRPGNPADSHPLGRRSRRRT